MAHESKTMDATTCSQRSWMSNCNGGKDNEINPTQKEILRDVGRTIAHMVTLNGATIEGARGMIDVMIRALDVGRTSKSSSNYKFPTSTDNESASLITDKDVHQCKACEETDTLSPKLWKQRRDEESCKRFCILISTFRLCLATTPFVASCLLLVGEFVSRRCSLIDFTVERPYA